MRRFLEITGYIVGIIGLILSIYFYEVSKKEREPTFITEPVRTEIINSEKLVNNPIKVLDSNGQILSRDLTSVRFYFWNKGKEAIKPENLLENIIISTGQGTRIVNYRILKEARKINGISLKSVDSNSIGVNFKILEFNDGFTGELLIEGDSKAQISIKGTIEGANSISSFALTNYKVLGKTIFYVIIGIMFIGMFFLSSGGGGGDGPSYIERLKNDTKYKDNADYKVIVDNLSIKEDELAVLQSELHSIENLNKKVKSEEDAARRKKFLRTILILVGIVVITGALIFSWYKVNQEITENPGNYIPTSIKP